MEVEVEDELEQLDMVGDERAGALADEVVAEIRRRVFVATGLTCSAGIGSNFMLAKVLFL